MEDKVKVKSLVSSRVILSVPDIRLKRVWEKKNAVKIIPFAQLEEAMYSPGVTELFEDGVLGIDDMEVKIALNLEPEGATQPVNIIVLDDKQRERYLTAMPVYDFAKEVKKLPKEQVMELAHYAIQNELMDYEKSQILLKLTDIDIMSAIKLNRDDKEAIKEAK